MTTLGKLISTTAFRHALVFLAVFLFSTSVLVGYIYWNTNILLARQFSETIGAEARGLAEQYGSGGIVRLVRVVRQRAAQPGTTLYLLTDAAGRPLAGNLSLAPDSLLGDEPWIEFAYERFTGEERFEHLGRGRVYVLPEGFRLLVGRNIEERRRFEVVVTSALAWSLGLTLLVGLPAGFLVARRMLKRVDRITDTSRRIMEGDLTERIPESGSNDELDRLARNLNAMLERIEQLMHGMKDVSDNIAHDLKTPLTRLRNRVETVLREEGSKEAYRAALEKTIEESDALIRVFNALLSIARVEARTRPGAREPIEAQELLQDVAELYEPLADEQGAAIVVKPGPPAHFSGDRDLLAQVIANLVDNALKYGRGSDGKAVIELSASTSDGHIGLTVADSGPGIAEADRARVQERFVRLEQSRSVPGSGLGLALAAAVARMYGGALRLSDNAPGLSATITFPVEQAASGEYKG